MVVALYWGLTVIILLQGSRILADLTVEVWSVTAWYSCRRWGVGGDFCHFEFWPVTAGNLCWGGGGGGGGHTDPQPQCWFLSCWGLTCNYHWRELPQGSFLSWQKFCHNKPMFVMTKHVFCYDKSMLVATKLLLWQTYFCRDKHIFVVTEKHLLSWQK